MTQAATNYQLPFAMPLVWSDRARAEMTCSESLFEAADNFLDLFNDKVAVVQNQKISGASGQEQLAKAEDITIKICFKEPTSWIITTLKVIGYLTIVLPLLALLSKLIYRSCTSFKKEFNWTELDLKKSMAQGLDLNRPYTHRFLHPAETSPKFDRNTRYLPPQTTTMAAGFDYITNILNKALLEDERSLVIDASLTPSEEQSLPAILAHFRDDDYRYCDHLSVADCGWMAFILDTFQSAGKISRYARVEEIEEGLRTVKYTINLPLRSADGEAKRA